MKESSRKAGQGQKMKRNRLKDHKYIFVVGGVMSGVGKGITTSSLGTILEAKGHKVNIIKVDPYLNVDAGTMNPTEHGEVFVLDSGLETDQDMGNYERFLNRSAEKTDYMTSGMVYKHVIEKERALGFGGRCIDADDIRDEIMHRIKHAAKVSDSDITIVEIGGTVGDYQNIMFIEAARVMRIKFPGDVIFLMVSYMPIPGKLGEMKSKPTQNAVKQLNSYGVYTDIIVARSSEPVDQKRKEKIAFSCNVPADSIISAPDIDSIYDVPLNFEHDKIGSLISKKLNIKDHPANLKDWGKFVTKIHNGTKHPLKIAVVGKYFDTGNFVLSDSYVSVIESIKFSGAHIGVKPVITWLNAKNFEGNSAQQKKLLQSLSEYDGIVVPGGFGSTGIEGKINVIKYAREQKIPLLGLCYGMQLITIEYARNVLGIKDAHTAEINPNSKNLVIDIMPEQKKKIAEGNYGGSMRLGAYEAFIKKGTVAFTAYSTAGVHGNTLSQHNSVWERHRHRYEVNPEYISRIEDAGLVFSGKSKDGRLMEIAELPRTGEQAHPFFLGSQFHPEFLARPLSPHPLFTEFLKAAAKNA